MEQIGRYQILNELGRGAMGVVLRAQDPAIGRVIAIKTIRLTDVTDPEERHRLRERLFREAQAAGVLSHPSIVTIYDIAEERGQACIFMEFVNGPTLEVLMGGPPPDRETFLEIFRQIAAALDYAHRKGIVHRDIKPANIMIAEDGRAKIADFGVAKVVSHEMTQSGTITGTPNYMSPEAVQGLNVDGRADQFSLAVIAYELLTGEKPFAAEQLSTLLYKIVRDNPAAPQRLNPSLGPRVEAVLRQSLSKNPAERYSTCTEFTQQLTEACNCTQAWMPLPRGASQSMPTMAVGRTPFNLPPRPMRESVAVERNPIMRTLVWVLVGIGLLGLVLLGGQKLLFNPVPAESAPEQASAAPRPMPAVVKPSPAGPPVKAAQAPAPRPELPGDSSKDDERQPEPQQTEKAQANNLPAEKAKGAPERSIQVLTDPPGAMVTIDGAISCKTPCMLSLPLGRHVLQSQLTGYRPYPKVFNLPGESDLFLNLAKSAGRLNVTSNPDGAEVAINGEVKTQRTPVTFSLAPGEYQVKVSRDGVPLEFSVEIRDNEIQTRNVKF